MAAGEVLSFETSEGWISTKFSPQVLQDMGRKMEGTPRPNRGCGLGNRRFSNFTTKSRVFVYKTCASNSLLVVQINE